MGIPDIIQLWANYLHSIGILDMICKKINEYLIWYAKKIDTWYHIQKKKITWYHMLKKKILDIICKKKTFRKDITKM